MNVEKLNRCPVQAGCAAKVLFRDKDTGNLYRLDARSQDFVPHECNTRNASKLPEFAYAAAWYNRETGRTRFIGPERLKRTVLKKPSDERYRRRGGNDAWELKKIYETRLDWKEVD